MIEIKNLSVQYNKKQTVKALEMVDLTIKKGEIVAVIGASGCGKSTLLKTMAGIISDYQGEIKIEGKLLEVRKNLVGYIPQGYGLLPWKTVMENCLIPLKIRGIKIDGFKKHMINSLFESLEIGDLSKRYPATLSGGQKQRVALVRALVLSPEILLMDEPFSALDAIMRDEATEIFLKVWKQNSCSTLIVTHSIDDAIYLGKRIVVMGGSPGKVKKIIENPLYGDELYKEHDDYKDIYHLIKEEIRGKNKIEESHGKNKIEESHEDDAFVSTGGIS